MKQLNISPQKTSIICAGLNFGSKVHVLYALLDLDPSNSAGSELIRKAHTFAERNSFAHGFIDSNSNGDRVLVTREIKYKYTVKSKPLDVASLASHVAKFGAAMFEVVRHFSLDVNNDLVAYAKSIADEAQVHELRAEQNRESQTNARLAKKQARARHAERSNPTTHKNK
jgi:hypothetical protein